ncbi:hypothetical protein [Marinicella sp. W31]|uniref:hypothetical protein n=1 Tax=Marinicella sp. W31 TaxID=3023713 RepID=UPI0037566C54
MNIKTISFILLACLYLPVQAQVDHSFTYQGELTDNGSPAQGVFDITIQAFDNANGTGNNLAESVHTNVPVNNGLFTIEQVNLGSSIFDGLDIWLQILVKESSESNFVALLPLQKMRSVPYASTLIDNGAVDGQVLTFSNTSGWQPSTPQAVTDDQNIESLSLNNTTLTVGIENGNSQNVDLASLQDGTGTDDQNIQGLSLNNTTLTVGIENGTSQDVDLASLQDGTGTDNQNISGSALNGTNLTIGIDNGNSQTVDLAPIQQGAGTKLIRISDNQVLGTVIGVTFNTKQWTIINNNGYIVHVDADGVPKIESALYNDGSCTTTPLYIQFAANKNDSGSISASQGLVFTIEDVGTYYVPKNTSLVDDATYNRRRNSPTNCQSLSQPVNTVIPIQANSEAVTGVPNGGYGPVTIQ